MRIGAVSDGIRIEPGDRVADVERLFGPGRSGRKPTIHRHSEDSVTGEIARDIVRAAPNQGSFGQRIRLAFAVEFGNGIMDGLFERGGVGEGLVGEVIGFEIARSTSWGRP